MYLDGKQQVELKVEQLNQRLTELSIPQLRFEFEPKLSLIRLTYQKSLALMSLIMKLAITMTIL